MQQWSINNQQNANQGGLQTQTNAANLSQFAFPAATPVMMQAPTLFASNPQIINNNQQKLTSPSIPRQTSADSHHSVGSGNGSPQSNHSGGSNDNNKKIWNKKQQELGDKLYQKVMAKTGSSYAPKITGMLIKMGDKKAQQCIDNPNFLDEQIQIAKKLLETEGLPNSQNINPNGMVSTTPTLLGQHSGSPTSNTPLMNRLNAQFGSNALNTINSPNGQLNTLNSPNRYQTLNTTKPVTPNAAIQQQQNIDQQSSLNSASIANLLTSSIPNSLYGIPSIFGTPQLFAMSPAPSSAAAASRTPQPVLTTPKKQPQQVNTQSIPHLNVQQQVVNQQQAVNINGQQTQYLFTTIPNLGSAPITTVSPAQQHTMFNVVTTPNSGSINNGTPNDAHTPQQMQQSSIQQSGWGLALNPNQFNAIQTQPATQFMQPALYPRQ